MSKISNLIMWVAYVLGLLAVVAALVFSFIPSAPNPIHVTTRGCLVFAITLFLCAIASYFVKKENN